MRGLGANLYGTGLITFVQLAGVPILLHFWGVHLYGEWIVLFAVPAYFSFANLGYSVAVTHDMTIRVARGDRDGALTAFHSLIAMIAIAAIAVTSILAICVSTLHVGHWFLSTDLEPWEGRWALLLLSAEVVIQLFGGINSAGFTANGDYALLVACNQTTIFLQYLALWSAAAFGGGVVGAAAGFLIVRLVATLILFTILLRRNPWLSFGVSQARKKYLREILAPSLTNLMLVIGTALVAQGMILVVATLSGPIAVATFAISRTLARLPLRPAIMLSQTIVPEVSAAEGAEEHGLKRRLFVGTLQAGVLLSIVSGAALYSVGDIILRIWTHGKVELDANLFAWLLASSVAAAAWNVSTEALQAVNRHVRAALVYAVVAASTVGLAWVLLQATSKLSSVAFAMFVGDVLFAAIAIPLAVKSLGGQLRTSLLDLVDPRTLMFSRTIQRRSS